MSHFEQQKFIEFSLDELKKKNNFNNLSVLDVGSFDVGGSIKDFFKKDFLLNKKGNKLNIIYNYIFY